MISGVIAKFDGDEPARRETMKQIASHGALEMGELIAGRNLPVTIESADNQEAEQITRWMLSLAGVAFVDVVFVHFEEDEPDSTLPGTSRNRETVNSADSARTGH